MRLTPQECDKLLIANAGQLAQRRLARGLKLNHPESIALIAFVILELVRDGKSVDQVMDIGQSLLGRRQVMHSVAELVSEVQVEATFRDGTKLVTIHEPIVLQDGDLTMALYGSFLPIPHVSIFDDIIEHDNGYWGEMKGKKTYTGQMICRNESLTLNKNRSSIRLPVTNFGDRPIQVGSHYHFIEVNAELEFDRYSSHGRRLGIAAGTAVRFEPGSTKEVTLVSIGGERIIRGGNGLASGPVDGANLAAIMSKVKKLGFRHKRLEEPYPVPPPVTMTHAHYASLYGPTTGDRVRLGDTNLIIEVEFDMTTYGDECIFGGGKVLRDGMGQCSGASPEDSLDVVITNALILDYTGIYKADIGVKNGRIHAIGKSGNPHIMDNVTPGMTVGVTTEVVAAEGLIVTAGGIDTHVHYVCPQLAPTALASGVTTLLGGGTGPTSGSKATTCTPGPYHIGLMLKATDAMPLNFAFTGKGNSSDTVGLEEQISGGAVGLKLHEDWGTSPACIDTCLGVAEKTGVQITIHTDTLNESSFVDGCISAFKDRSIHTYHSEGAGGGHAPDIIRVCGESNVIPSSTNPTRPFTANTLSEHLDMLMVCHHLNRNIAEDVAFAESRIRAETIAAEDILHDMGALSIISSDAQAMGRIGEVICRTWQTAAKMKEQRGHLPPDETLNAKGHCREMCENNDNFRARRYVAKYTVNPAIAHGLFSQVGSIEQNKLADLVLWKPAFFGVKPELVLKSGFSVFSQMGDANASIPSPEPFIGREMFAAHGGAVGATSISFVSAEAEYKNIGKQLGLKKRIVAIDNCRTVRKENMQLNSLTPTMKVDPERYVVTADEVPLNCEPARIVPLAQRYFLF